MKDAVFKICIFGDGGVGKTSLVNRYLTGVFTESTSMTLGVDFHIKSLVFNELEVGLQIWDFAGEDEFRHLLPRYVLGASGGIFMYDITRYTSLTHLDEWLDVFKEGMKGEEKQIPFMMAGGKLDLKENRTISPDEATELAISKDFSSYIECSSKTGENIEWIFSEIARLMLEKAELV
jgi:small GTP-binding protein